MNGIEITSSGPVRFGLCRMISRHPLFAVLIDNWKIIEDPTIPTMSVCPDSNLNVVLRYNSAFAVSVSPDELVGVLLHEVHHILFRHYEMKPEEYPDRSALVAAQEVTVNEFITEPLPGNPLRLHMFGLPPGENTVRRYHRLADSASARKPAPSLVTVDEHVWENTQKQENTILATVILNDLQNVLLSLPEEIRSAEENKLIAVSKHMQGCNPKDMLITVAEEGIPRTDWAVVLRALLRKMSHSVPCLHRPSRRLPHLIGIVPGKRRTVGRPKVIAVIDTSGSMNNHKVLSLIREEIKSLSSAADIWVVECDTKIHREYRYNGKLEHVRGGGGTSFVEPLSSQFLAQHRASLVLYFTDGRGNAPMQNPRIPVLWCLIGQKTRKPADYGKVLRIASPLEKEVF